MDGLGKLRRGVIWRGQIPEPEQLGAGSQVSGDRCPAVATNQAGSPFARSPEPRRPLIGFLTVVTESRDQNLGPGNLLSSDPAKLRSPSRGSKFLRPKIAGLVLSREETLGTRAAHLVVTWCWFCCGSRNRRLTLGSATLFVESRDSEKWNRPTSRSRSEPICLNERFGDNALLERHAGEISTFNLANSCSDPIPPVAPTWD